MPTDPPIGNDPEDLLPCGSPFQVRLFRISFDFLITRFFRIMFLNGEYVPPETESMYTCVRGSTCLDVKTYGASLHSRRELIVKIIEITNACKSKWARDKRLSRSNHGV